MYKAPTVYWQEDKSKYHYGCRTMTSRHIGFTSTRLEASYVGRLTYAGMKPQYKRA